MFKNVKSIVNLFILAVLTVLIGTIAIKVSYDKALVTPNSDNPEKITLNIEEGETVDQILNKLVEKGLIRKSWTNYIKFYLRQKDLSATIQAGIFEIPKNLNIIEIIETLQNGKNPDIWVTIQEGLRKDEIANKLNTELSEYTTTNFSTDEFLSLTTDFEYIQTLGLNSEVKDLEGYIFPDKYAFAPEVTTKQVLDIMINNFKNKVGTEDTYQDIIKASIVEREGYNSEDRPIIAGIIDKRLREGWLLQTDATLLYLGKDWKHEITDADKQADNEYNTYKKTGLPPTPICNPGLQAIEAVRKPTSTNYYYYIHANDGSVHFAETLEQHNANINQYLR